MEVYLKNQLHVKSKRTLLLRERSRTFLKRLLKNHTNAMMYENTGKQDFPAQVKMY